MSETLTAQYINQMAELMNKAEQLNNLHAAHVLESNSSTSHPESLTNAEIALYREGLKVRDYIHQIQWSLGKIESFTAMIEINKGK